VEKSLSGNYRHVRVQAGRIIAIYAGSQFHQINLAYRIAGRLPGVYTMPPARVVSLYQPKRYAYSDSRTLEVLDPGKISSDPFQLTPDEMYYLGKKCFEEGDKEAAYSQLNGLRAYNLGDEAAKETSRILLLLAIERNDAAAVLRHSETLKE